MADKEKKGPDRTMCGIMAILLGGFGVHKFMMGQTTPGIIMIVLTLCTCTGVHDRLDRGHHLPDEVRRRVLPNLRRREESLVLILRQASYPNGV